MAGLVAIAMAGLWIAYLVPHRLRYRQQLLESRTDDRFSERLRVVRVARTAPRGATAERQMPARPRRVLLHPPRAGQGGGSMDRPHGTSDRIAADAARRSAAEHAGRAAHLARRAAAARRRAVLAVTLLAASLTAWGAVGLAGASVAVAVVLSVLLSGVLVLGRRAVVAAARADSAWVAGAATRLPATAGDGRRLPTAVGRAVQPSEAVTEVMARVAVPDAVQADAGDGAVPAVPDVEAPPAPGPTPEAIGWVPVPVPRPTYTLKPAARRPDPAPLVLQDAPAAARAAEAQTPAGGVADRPVGLDLDAILARRRAAGQ